MAKLATARDLKSLDPKGFCGFDSRSEYKLCSTNIYSKVTNSNKYFIITIVIVVLKLLSPIRIGVWRKWLAHLADTEEVLGSNPSTPTINWGIV